MLFSKFFSLIPRRLYYKRSQGFCARIKYNIRVTDIFIFLLFQWRRLFQGTLHNINEYYRGKTEQRDKGIRTCYACDLHIISISYVQN